MRLSPALLCITTSFAFSCSASPALTMTKRAASTLPWFHTPHENTRILLLKTEPKEYSIDDLAANKDGGAWTGVRNHSAKKNLSALKLNDLCLIYHSSAGKQTGLVGLAKVIRTAYPDPTALDPQSPLFDPKSKRDNPPEKQWQSVDVELLEKFEQPLLLTTLNAMRQDSEEIDTLQMFSQTRLSCSEVTLAQFRVILEAVRLTPPSGAAGGGGGGGGSNKKIKA